MALRRLETITNTKTGKSAKVYRDAVWNEWRVRYYDNGVLNAAADSFHSDQSDAQTTARTVIWYPR
jgi:hypothetical protein